MTIALLEDARGIQDRMPFHPLYRVARRSQQRSGNWAVAFVGVLIFFQIALFFFGDTSIRLPLRIGGYAASLAILVLLNGRGANHPASKWAWAAITILAIEIVNPNGDSLTARVAQGCLYSAVLAPLLWTGRLKIDRKVFRTVIYSLWGFYTASAVFGVLQVEYPGRFDGATSSNYDEGSLVPHTLTLGDGRQVIRPKGLSDTPGGAGYAGVFTILIGMGVILASPGVVLRGLGLGGMGIGLFCIYIGQGRTNLLIVGFAFLLVISILVRRGSVGKAMILGYIGFGVASVGTSMAFLIGGQSVIDRFTTLVADDAGTVYQANRGQFLNELLTQDIFTYPFGAGMGHWGMMCGYFGNVSTSLWAEMLWQALCYDGGIPLIITYLALFGSMLWMAWRLAMRRKENELTDWGAIIFAYTLAALAASFSYPLMSIQGGMELTLVNACLYAANRSESDAEKLESSTANTRSFGSSSILRDASFDIDARTSTLRAQAIAKDLHRFAPLVDVGGGAVRLDISPVSTEQMFLITATSVASGPISNPGATGLFKVDVNRGPRMDYKFTIDSVGALGPPPQTYTVASAEVGVAAIVDPNGNMFTGFERTVVVTCESYENPGNAVDQPSDRDLKGDNGLIFSSVPTLYTLGANTNPWWSGCTIQDTVLPGPFHDMRSVSASCNPGNGAEMRFFGSAELIA